MSIDSFKDPEIKIHIFPTKRVTEKYNSKIKVEKYKRDPSVVNCHIGNSGLQIRFFNNDERIKFVFDYYPNVLNNDNKKDTRAIKSSLFGSALLSFRNWLNDPVNQKEYSFDTKKFSKLSNFTNDKMARFTKKLFSENGHPEMVDINESGIGIYLSIDLGKFCKLPDKDELIQYLKRMDQRTKNVLLTYDKVIQPR